MSELSQTQNERLELLLELSYLIIQTGNASAFLKDHDDFIDTIIPNDFIVLFDQLIKEGYKIDELKIASNKIINIFGKTIKAHPSLRPQKDSFLYVLSENNATMVEVLNEIRVYFKAYNDDDNAIENIVELIRLFEKLQVFSNHYVIKENTLFPVIEKNWKNYRCLQIMWSFHDDIRRNIKHVLRGLKNGVKDKRSFNRAVGDIFFNMRAVKFREEEILFPSILGTISNEQLLRMNYEGSQIGFPYVQAKLVEAPPEELASSNDLANLKTGQLSIEQIILIFNHLPVDITFVDENDRVRYFSTPKKRLFPRTTAILGREVSNCHPPESVHVVEQIVQSFKQGEKDSAEFWIKMRSDYILIQYFAVRDESNTYRGVLEVTQEISDIKALEGEKRLLDW